MTNLQGRLIATDYEELARTRQQVRKYESMFYDLLENNKDKGDSWHGMWYYTMGDAPTNDRFEIDDDLVTFTATEDENSYTVYLTMTLEVYGLIAIKQWDDIVIVWKGGHSYTLTTF